MLEVTGERGLDVKMLEQLAGVTRVLRRDQYRLPQNTNRPRRHILQVADRRCNQIKSAHEMIVAYPGCEPDSKNAMELKSSMAFHRCRMY